MQFSMYIVCCFKIFQYLCTVQTSNIMYNQEIQDCTVRGMGQPPQGCCIMRPEQRVVQSFVFGYEEKETKQLFQLQPRHGNSTPL